MATGFDPAAHAQDGVLRRAALQAQRYEERILHQKDSINRLLKDGAYDTEMGKLHEIIAVQAQRLAQVRIALGFYQQANTADGKTFGANAADGLKLANLVQEALDASTED